MPNDQRGAARAAVVQNTLRPKLTGVTPRSPITPSRMPSARPTTTNRALPRATAQGRGANPQIKQHSAPPQRIAQAKIAQPRALLPKALQQRSATFRSAVVQRAVGNSAFNPGMAVNPHQFVVTQVDSALGGMFGHSELFIEHWIAAAHGAPARVGAFKIHVQTLNGTKIDIVPIGGAIDTQPPRVRGHRSYTATQQQVDTIMQTAIQIRTKFDEKKIYYAEIFPDRDDKWRTTNTAGGAEMSCKSFTDTLLMEAGLRAGFGGTFINHPSDL